MRLVQQSQDCAGISPLPSHATLFHAQIDHDRDGSFPAFHCPLNSLALAGCRNCRSSRVGFRGTGWHPAKRAAPLHTLPARSCKCFNAASRLPSHNSGSSTSYCSRAPYPASRSFAWLNRTHGITDAAHRWGRVLRSSLHQENAEACLGFDPCGPIPQHHLLLCFRRP